MFILNFSLFCIIFSNIIFNLNKFNLIKYFIRFYFCTFNVHYIFLDKDFSFIIKVRSLIKISNILFYKLVHTLNLASFPPSYIVLAALKALSLLFYLNRQC